MVEALAGFTLAALAVMGSPGPATLSVMAMGAAYGFQRALPYAIGIIAGTSVVLVAVSLGLVSLLSAVPGLVPVLGAVAVLYILYLAYRIATAPPLGKDHSSVKVPTFQGAATLALANPKAYLAIGSVFAGARLEDVSATADFTIRFVLMLVLIIVIHLGWLVVGTVAARAMQRPRTSRIVNLAMALALVASCALLAMSLFTDGAGGST